MGKKSTTYDICIVGAGPAGLSCLSAIREPYSIDNLTEPQVQRALHSLKTHRQPSVCVIDPRPQWMSDWNSNFEQLNIKNLRSPTMAHPDMFDTNALLEFAAQQGRDKTELFESGCADIKGLIGLGQTQDLLWKLPSTKLFTDFCKEMANRLDHTYQQGSVMDLHKNDDGTYCIQSSDSDGITKTVSARNVILAMGIVGRPIVPKGLVDCPTLPWKSPEAFASTPSRQRVLVVGGGLTAVQAALRVLEDGNSCVLCSRRPLREKHFDVAVEWFDRRTANKCLSDFYHDNIGNRLKLLKGARDGGSIPPMYMRRLEAFENNLTYWVGDVEYSAQDSNENGGIQICFENSLHKFDKVVLACGVRPDFCANPLIEKLRQQWPIPIHGGMPDVTEDMRWHDGNGEMQNIFVVGAMAGLQVGPDSGNLMGARRAALVVADFLECRCWHQQKEVLGNKFDVLFLSDSDTESESDEDDCSTCCDETECLEDAILTTMP